VLPLEARCGRDAQDSLSVTSAPLGQQRRYNIVSEDDVREGLRRTAAYVAGLPTERKLVPIDAAAA